MSPYLSLINKMRVAISHPDQYKQKLQSLKMEHLHLNRKLLRKNFRTEMPHQNPTILKLKKKKRYHF